MEHMMKRLICIAFLASLLGGCVVVPAGPGYGYHRGYVEPPVMVVPPYGGYGPWSGHHRGHDRRW